MYWRRGATQRIPIGDGAGLLTFGHLSWPEGVQMADVADLMVQVQPVGDDDVGELLDLTSMLRSELLTLDVSDVRPLEASAAPEGAKGLGAVAGWLAVQLGSIEGLRATVDLIRGWVGRTRREVEVRIGDDVLKVSGVSSAEQEKIIDAWLARHAAGS
jgi:hypothetical protein